MIRTEDPEKFRRSIHEKTKEWHGVYSESISLSIGYASHKEHPDLSIDELERIADADMYSEKEKYYKENGIDRRRN